MTPFAIGSSPTDFPAEDYERTRPDRFTADGLDETGRRGLGLKQSRAPDWLP